MKDIPADMLGEAPSQLHSRLFATRRRSLDLAAPLSPEDQCVQAMDDASPTKWHLAHTTWFFETFVLAKHLPGYKVFDDTFHYCFNSYYEAEGPRHPRPYRGLLTRPSHADVIAYRHHVDSALQRLAESGIAHEDGVTDLLELGVNHEEQHQELLLTDILALFAANPLRPAYASAPPMQRSRDGARASWVSFDGGIRAIGHAGEGFAFDNETPRHEVLLQPFRLASRLVTHGQWQDFMRDGGYSNAALWLSDGWSTVKREGWTAPLYYEEHDGAWKQMSLHGLQPIDPDAPVTHISFYEADAFARWAGKRLPSEFEWEIASARSASGANTLESGALRPLPASGAGLQQMFGDCWEWTSSAYLPYPRFRAAAGAVGEYNGKFMVNQHVLRGASCVTAPEHSRATYRNFFYPHQRWQFMGLRLADDAA
jgi:ergothioneine biosynthesis protein EgtB